MASANPQYQSNNPLQRYFSADVCKQLADDDTLAGKTVSLILIAIIGGGLLSMIISLWFAL